MAHRLFYDNLSLTGFDAHVTDIRERSREDGQSVWQIALDRTAFYPTSGGQPHDLGKLRATAPSGATLEIPVLAVEEDEAGEVWHLTSKPLLAGTAVEGAVDAARRLDHVQQHSGQHLLSAVFLRELKAPTVSFHLGDDTSTIDLALAIEALSPEELERVELAANRIAAECRPVTQRMVPQTEAQALLAAGELRKLPSREGPIRIVTIAGVEQNACGGTHVANTGQIGALLLRSTEKVHGGARVSFVCGGRAVRSARHDNLLLTRTAADLSTSRADLPDAIQRFRSDLKAAQKQAARMREELADYHAVRLLVEDPIRSGRRFVRRIFPDRDAAYIKLLASRLTAATPQTIVLLASMSESPATLVLACSQDVDLDCGSRLKEVLAAHNGRGGGSPTMAQGQVAASALEQSMQNLQATETAPH